MKVQLSVAILSFAVVGYSADYHWSGLAADNKWSSSGNWEENLAPGGAPDDVVYVDCNDETTIVLTEQVTVGKVRFTGDGKLVLNKEENGALALTASGGWAVAWSNSCALVCNLDVTLPSSSVGTYSDQRHASIWAEGETVFNGKVLSAGTDFFRIYNGLKSTTLTFNGEISVPSATLLFEACTSPIYVNGPVYALGHRNQTSGSLAGHVYIKGPLSFSSGSYMIGYRRHHCAALGVLNQDIFLDFTGYAQYGGLHLDGYDQTINYITGAEETSVDTSSPVRYIDSESPATLTLRATQSATAYAFIRGNVSIVYDATEKGLVQTFRNRPNDTSGSIIVKKGGILLEGGATFNNVPELTIADGASFGIGSENGVANPMAGLKKLRVAGEGVLGIPAGVSLNVERVFVDGVALPDGTYSSDGQGGSTVATWISGGGTIAVCASSSATYWKGSQDGNWAQSDKWTAGVPTFNKTAIVDSGAAAGEASYEISVASSPAQAKDLIVDAEGELPVRLLVGDELEVRGDLTLARNAVVEIENGGNLVWDGALAAGGAASIAKGAELSVTGGKATFTNLVAKIQVGGSSDVTSRVTVASGEVLLQKTGSSGGLRILDNGMLNATGGVVRLASEGEVSMLDLAGGTMAFSGNAKLDDQTLSSHYLVTGYGTAIFGNASSYGWPIARNLFVSSVAGDLDFLLKDDSLFDLRGAESIRLVSESGGAVKMTVANNATFEGAKSMYVASAADAVATLTVEGRAYVKAATFYGVYVAASSGARGKIKVTGGLLDNYIGSTSYYQQTGLHLGVGDSCTGQEVVYDRKGELEISGGVVSNRYGLVNAIIGQGSAEGVVNQSGGKFVVWSYFNEGAVSHQCGLIIGLRGGKGEYNLSGGSVEGRYVYVGGAIVDKGTTAFYSDLTDRGGFGKLNVSGGEFGTDRDVFVSLAGQGEVSVTGGKIVARNMYLTNSVDAVTAEHYDASVKFALDGDGKCGCVELTDKLYVAKGAKLSVDLGGLAKQEKSKCTLITAAKGIEGSFDLEDISFTGEDAQNARLVVRPTSIGVSVKRGMAIIVR